MAESRTLVVNVSDAAASGNPSVVITTYSLGSCIAVSLWDPAVKVGGMLHFQLPDSKEGGEKAARQPFMYADSGIAALVEDLLSKGAAKSRLRVKIAGGAAMKTGPKGFDIGKRNYLAVRKTLWKTGMFIDGEDIGGELPRNMYLAVKDGTVYVKCAGKNRPL